MKLYLLTLPVLLSLTACTTINQDNTTSNKLIVAQLCTSASQDGKIKEITMYPLNLVKGSKNATEKLNSLILPAAPLDMNFLGITPDKMAIYSGIVGNAQSLRYILISEGKEHMSFKRDFTKYNQDWSKWEYTDEINVGDMSKNNKVRFKTVISNSPIYDIRFSNTIPDSCKE